MRLLLLLALALPLAADAPVYLTAGAMRCGAVLRGADQVQVWCWSGLAYAPSTAIYNNVIFTARVNPVECLSEWGEDVILWTFLDTDGTITYEASANGGTPIKGTL